MLFSMRGAASMMRMRQCFISVVTHAPTVATDAPGHMDIRDGTRHNMVSSLIIALHKFYVRFQWIAAVDSYKVGMCGKRL